MSFDFGMICKMSHQPRLRQNPGVCAINRSVSCNWRYDNLHILSINWTITRFCVITFVVVSAQAYSAQEIYLIIFFYDSYSCSVDWSLCRFFYDPLSLVSDPELYLLL